MIDHRIRMRHLRCFMETAQRGSLSAAADALNISQPAASKTVRELETILSQALFDRTSRRLSLSPAGRVFQQHIGAAMIEMRRAQDLVQEAPRPRTRIAIGALPTASTDLTPLAALEFRRTFPDCLIRVSTGPNWLLMSQLREGALDMVVGRMASAKVMEGLSFRHLYSETISAVVRPGHPLEGAASPERRLTDYPLMLPPSGAVIAPLVRSFLVRRTGAAPAPAFESVSLAFGRRVVRDSDVIWFISRGVVRNELEAGVLASLPISEDLLGGPVGVSMREDGVMSPEQSGLLAALETVAGRRLDRDL
ncbi:MAG: LysR substrate-binding domain-containing protein [Pseudomonadota bacterium]